MNLIKATYFDGLSSVSRDAIVEFDVKMQGFRFNTEHEAPIFWKFEDLQFDKYGALTEIRNKNYSGAILKIEDENFSRHFYETMKKNRRIDIHTRLLNLGFSTNILIAVCLFGLVILAYFYALPPIAEKSVFLIPEGFDDEIGEVFMESFLDHNDVDKEKTKYLEQFASELDLGNKKPLKFMVVKSKDINAFALPNGQIVVYSAILNNMKSPDELAALLGHEASHVNHRHSIKMLSRNLAGYFVVSLLFSDVNGIMAVLADNAQQLHSLSYSRNFEEQADEEGLKILMDNNVNPKGMMQLFEQLEKNESVSIPKIMSTHPLTKERKANMNSIIAISDYTVKENSKLSAIFKGLKSSEK